MSYQSPMKISTSSTPSLRSNPDPTMMQYPGLHSSASSASLASSSRSAIVQESPASTPATRSENGDNSGVSTAEAAAAAAAGGQVEKTALATNTTSSAAELALEDLEARVARQAQQDFRARQQRPRGSCRPGDYILVTGGLGYIGSHTALELLKAGYNVIVVDNLANSYSAVRWRIQALATWHFESEGIVPAPTTLAVHEMDYQSPAMRLLLEQYSCPNEEDSFAAAAGVVSGGAADTAPSPCHGGGSRRSRIGGVVHFAAFKSVEQSIGDPLAYYDNNVCGLVGFIRLLAEFDVRNFVFSSSATVYGSKANLGQPLFERDVTHHKEEAGEEDDDDDDAVEPAVQGLTCPYARTKYFSEAILADVARSDPRWRIVALRYFNPVGCDSSGLLGESPRTTPTNLFPVLAQVLAGQREALDVFGRDWPTRDGTAVRDYIHVADVARGHVAALDSCDRLASSCNRRRGDDAASGDCGRCANSSSNKRSPLSSSFRTYNLGSGTGTSVLEIVDSVAAATKRPVPMKLAGRRSGDVGTCVASTARAEAELGWFPRVDIGQSARDWWNYIRRTHKIQDGAEAPDLGKTSLAF